MTTELDMLFIGRAWLRREHQAARAPAFHTKRETADR